MDGDPFDTSGMIRALEDYLDATRPPEPPAPPREKTETETNLEKLLGDLTTAAPPSPEPVKDAPPPAAEPQDVQPLPERLELSSDSPRDEMVDEPLAPEEPEPLPEPPQISETAPPPIEDVAADLEDLPDAVPAAAADEEIAVPANVVFKEDVVVAETQENDDDVPAPPKAAPIYKWLLGAAIVLALAPVLITRRTPQFIVKRRAPIARSIQPSTKLDPLPSDPRSRAIALILAYCPAGAPVTAGEIFRSIAGDPIPDANWEVKPMGGDRFTIRFVPYRGALGENNSYEFNVDAGEGWARPRPETAERLRTDALGRLAARSNLEAFRQFLDLGR